MVEGVPVSGKVVLPNGSPLTGGMLVLRPETGLHGATAPIQADGQFALENGGRSAIAPGKYQVYLRFTDRNQANLRKSVAERYQQSSEDGDSQHFIEIQNETDDLVIQLKK